MTSYSDEELLNEIRRIADRSGVDGTLSSRVFDQHAEMSSSTVHRQFGSWTAAIKQAGLTPNTETTKIPRDDLIAELRRLRKEVDQIPTIDQMDEYGAYAYITYYERFGSWKAALEEAFEEIPDREWEHVSDGELLAELRRLSGENDGRPRMTDVKEHGSHALTTYISRFGSWRAAVEAAGFEPPPSQDVTTEELLAELRHLHTQLGARPTTTLVRKHGEYSVQTYYNRFGSWSNALEAAFETVPEEDSLDEEHSDKSLNTKNYSDKELLEEIRRVATVADSDGAPSISDFDEHSPIADSTIHRRFGSWNAGVKKAGFEPNSAGPTISDDELAAELRRLRDAVGHVPTTSEMDEQGAHSSATYKNRYGSWTAALVEIFDDVTPPINARKQSDGTQLTPGNSGPRVSTEKLVDDLHALADTLGRSPTSKDMREHGSHSAQTYMNRFGSWEDALAAAEIDPPSRNKIADADLIADLHRLRDKLGEQPTSTDVAREGTYGLATYQRRFGSWGEAAAAAFDDN